MEFIGDLKIIWRFLSKYKRQFYIVFVVAIFASSVEAIIPYIYGKIIDLIIADETVEVIFGILLLWLVLSLVRDWGKRYVFIKGRTISMRCMHDLVLLLNEHSLKLNLQYHKSQKSGKLSSRYIKASDALEDLLNEVVFWFGRDMIMLFFVLLLMAIFIKWVLVLVILLNILVYFAISLKYSRESTNYLVKVIKSYEDAFGFIHDSVSNIHTVKSNSKEEYENKKVSSVFENKTRKFYEKFLNVLKKESLLQETSFVAGILTLFVIMVLMFKNNEITVGQITSVIVYLGLINIPVRRIGMHIDQFRRKMGVLKRGYSLLDEETEPYYKKGAIHLKRVRGEIEFRNVSFFYHETRQVLRNISFKVRAGEIVALVGESGVGKSTMVDLISRYNIPTSGKIFLDGIDIQKIDLRSLRKQIAIVPQEVGLFNDTLRNNITYGKLDASEEEIWEAVKAANADEFINSFPNKLDQEVGERGVKLSTGQKQRVAIARAILKDPKILILDEATSALDSKSEMLVQDALKKLIKGRTTFVIAHRLSTIVNADKILVIDKGRIVEEGKHKELLANRGLYYRFFTLQSLGESDR